MDGERVVPGPGQESVWDYPRPPRLERSRRHVRVEFGGEAIAESDRAYRVLETSHPPVYYIPLEDIQQVYLQPAARSSFCEWKGQARYYTVVVGEREAPNAAWSYPEPMPGFEAIANHVAFYPQLMDGCFVDNEQVRSQEGGFYGGWVTSDIVGPFKGGTGTAGW